MSGESRDDAGLRGVVNQEMMQSCVEWLIKRSCRVAWRGESSDDAGLRGGVNQEMMQGCLEW